MLSVLSSAEKFKVAVGTVLDFLSLGEAVVGREDFIYDMCEALVELTGQGHKILYCILANG